MKQPPSYRDSNRAERWKRHGHNFQSCAEHGQHRDYVLSIPQLFTRSSLFPTRALRTSCRSSAQSAAVPSFAIAVCCRSTFYSCSTSSLLVILSRLVIRCSAVLGLSGHPIASAMTACSLRLECHRPDSMRFARQAASSMPHASLKMSSSKSMHVGALLR